MEIICPKILMVKEDITVSSIAKLFEPIGEIAQAFLTEALLCGTLVPVVCDDELPTVRKIFGICIAPKGQTFRGVLNEGVMKGWSYETLGGWYTRHTRAQFSENICISTPGTIYLDENYVEWIPVVETVTSEKTVGKIFMERISSRRFKFDRLILVSRIVEE